MILPTISSEQNDVIQQLRHYNVCVDSVAGSGKTTCSLHIARQFTHLKILLLTYNAKLKTETREKVDKLGLSNIEVHSYHSFCVKYYDRTCFTDTQIYGIINSHKNTLKQFRYDLIILDELQDCTPLYYQLVCKLYNDNGIKQSKICIFGDKFQSIFAYNKADERFIILADKLFNLNSFEWKKCKLTISYRLTNEMSQFINDCVLHDNRIQTIKVDCAKPRYVICDCWDSNQPFEEFNSYLKLGYKPEEMFILAPSLKNENTGIRRLENQIKLHLPDVAIYVPTNDDAKLDNEVLRGKLVFSTFHQAKGLERKVVIIFNFDKSYFTYYNNDANPYTCPNELYVALTRGIERISLMHHYRNDYLPFLNKDALAKYCELKLVGKQIIINPARNNIKLTTTSPTDLLRHLPLDVINECYALLQTVVHLHPSTKTCIPSKVYNENNTCEEVSDITGIAIPCYLELERTGKINILDELITENYISQNTNGCLISDIEFDNLPIPHYSLDSIQLNTITPDQMLFIATMWNSYKTGYLFKLYQIKSYNWLTQDHLKYSIARMNASLTISKNAVFEKKYLSVNSPELLNRRLTGFVDCVDDNNLYEFKCVDTLKPEHFLQLALYAYLHENDKLNTINEGSNQIADINNELDIIDCHINTLTVQIAEIDNEIVNLNMNLAEIGLIPVKSDYEVGDTIRFKLLNLDEGVIKQIKKQRNGQYSVKVSTKNSGKLDIPLSCILSIVSKNCPIKNSRIMLDKLHNRKQLAEQDILKYDNSKTVLISNKFALQNNIAYTHSSITNYYLYNILTNELVQIECSLDILTLIVSKLFMAKFSKSYTETDEVFLTKLIGLRHCVTSLPDNQLK